MIFVSPVGLRYPADWYAKSDAALAAAREAPDATARGLIIDQNQSVWRDLAGALADLSHLKCWYCETPALRDDLYVEHFRPKRRVAEVPSHPGYWWLSFKSENYRLTCKYCNERRVGETQGGKGSHFPLIAEADRAATEQDDIRREAPILLDPAVVTDPPLLDFTTYGTPIPAPEISATDRLRVEESIKIYHLHDGRISMARAAVASEVAESISRVEADYKLWLAARASDRPSGEVAELSSRWRDELGRLASKVSSDASFAGQAMAVIRLRRSSTERPFLDAILGHRRPSE